MMSGGVDSSVAAALLEKQGFLVTGVFMKNWNQEQLPGCSAADDEQYARRSAAKLGIPFYVLDFEKEYKERVFDPFLKGIRRGVTPNPDVFCNGYIKFGVFLERALALGADFVATGHYARLTYKLKPKTYKLLKAKDKHKDQTYFLYRLNQFQLSQTLFPIGDYLKSEVRAMAKELGLPTFDKPDSQGICFVGEEPFEDFLSRFIPSAEGVIVDRQGKAIGRHRGVPFYTIGQRRGLGIGGLGAPLFVAEKDALKNRLIVVPEGDERLYQKIVRLKDAHWIAGNAPSFPFTCKARIRYRQELQQARITKMESRITVRFKKSQRAITPGQSVVFYKRQEVLGGGIIS